MNRDLLLEDVKELMSEGKITEPSDMSKFFTFSEIMLMAEELIRLFEQNKEA